MTDLFIYTCRATTLRLVGILILAAILLVTLAVMVPVYGNEAPVSADDGQEISFPKIRTNEDRVSFLAQFGLQVEGEPEEEEVRLPSEFDRVFAAYNELQKRQGLDLSRYAGRKVRRYTYRVTNYGDTDRPVYATVIIYKNRVIGGDLCSPGQGGFVQTFDKK